MNGLMVVLTKVLGLAPAAPKKGAREAATFAYLFACSITTSIIVAAIYYNDPNYLSQGSPVIAALFIPALGLFAHAYHLKSVELQKPDSPPTPADSMPDWEPPLGAE